MQLNREFYRNLIMDGALITQGWLDRAKVERMLSMDYSTHGGGAVFVYLLVSAEAWFKSWQGSGARAAA